MRAFVRGSARDPQHQWPTRLPQSFHRCRAANKGVSVGGAFLHAVRLAAGRTASTAKTLIPSPRQRSAGANQLADMPNVRAGARAPTVGGCETCGAR